MPKKRVVRKVVVVSEASDEDCSANGAKVDQWVLAHRSLSLIALARETIRVTLFPFLRTYSVPFTPYFTFFLGGGSPVVNWGSIARPLYYMRLA
jgi:hypothetical protein